MALIQLPPSMTEQEERTTQNTNNQYLDVVKLPKASVNPAALSPGQKVMTTDTGEVGIKSVGGDIIWYATVGGANAAVPTSRKVNGKALSGDINLTAADVGAYAKLISAIGDGNTRTLSVNDNFIVRTSDYQGASILKGLEDYAHMIIHVAYDMGNPAGLTRVSLGVKANGAFDRYVTIHNTGTLTLTTNPYGTILVGGYSDRQDYIRQVIIAVRRWENWYM